jgi:membrane-associated phospholipid phosphatase
MTRHPSTGGSPKVHVRRGVLALVAVAALAAPLSVATPGFSAVAESTAPQPDTVTQWNLTMITGLKAAGSPPPIAARTAAIVQASVFDAVNGIEFHYAPYHVSPAAAHGASRDAAAAAAAYTALVGLLPVQKPTFEAQLSSTLAQISDNPSQPGPAVERGLSWGQTVAQEILAWRSTDGIDAVLPPYSAGTAAGDWQPTPPKMLPPQFRQFAHMTPFGLTSPSQFLPPGPPPLTSSEYAQDLAEVQTLGGTTSSVRTTPQTRIAEFWQDDTPAAMWNRVADQLAAARHLPLLENARRLALMNIALADGTIAVWNAKNTYNFWRPVTAIRSTSDPTWTPLLTTPAFQEYPSAHAGVSSAAATVLTAFYGDNTPFTVTSAGFGNATRTFTSFSVAVQEVKDARIYAGFHFRFSTRDGATLGSQVGNYVLEHLMQRQHRN